MERKTTHAHNSVKKPLNSHFDEIHSNRNFCTGIFSLYLFPAITMSRQFIHGNYPHNYDLNFVHLPTENRSDRKKKILRIISIYLLPRDDSVREFEYIIYIKFVVCSSECFSPSSQLYSLTFSLWDFCMYVSASYQTCFSK